MRLSIGIGSSSQGRSLKGCQIVAGGRQTTGCGWKMICCTPYGVRETLVTNALAPLQGAICRSLFTGGLRYASTSGYFRATLRVATRLTKKPLHHFIPFALSLQD